MRNHSAGENRHVRQKSTACSLLVQPYREIKNPAGRTQRGFYSGDVLLSRGLSPHYHRGCSVSLPCSEWERVVPLRYYHQRSEPDWRFRCLAATPARGGISDDNVDLSKNILIR